MFSNDKVLLKKSFPHIYDFTTPLTNKGRIDKI